MFHEINIARVPQLEDLKKGTNSHVTIFVVSQSNSQSHIFARSANTKEDLVFLIKFMKAVEKHPCLWNYTLKDYSESGITALRVIRKSVTKEFRDKCMHKDDER